MLQVNLEWLDLSFNSISKLEGLEKLVKLTDLSLFSNKLDKIENIQNLTELVVLSLGDSSRHYVAIIQSISGQPTATTLYDYLTPETNVSQSGQ